MPAKTKCMVISKSKLKRNAFVSTIEPIKTPYWADVLCQSSSASSILPLQQQQLEQ